MTADDAQELEKYYKTAQGIVMDSGLSGTDENDRLAFEALKAGLALGRASRDKEIEAKATKIYIEKGDSQLIKTGKMDKPIAFDYERWLGMVPVLLLIEGER